MKKSQKNILGIDWGSKYVWAAYWNSAANIVMPIWYLQNDPSLFFNLGDIISRYNIGTIVVGLPKDKKVAPQVEEFIKWVKFIAWEIPVEVEDEEYSSVEANAQKSHMNKDHLTDTLAAMIILQRYLKRFDWLSNWNV